MIMNIKTLALRRAIYAFLFCSVISSCVTADTEEQQQLKEFISECYKTDRRIRRCLKGSSLKAIENMKGILLDAGQRLCKVAEKDVLVSDELQEEIYSRVRLLIRVQQCCFSAAEVDYMRGEFEFLDGLYPFADTDPLLRVIEKLKTKDLFRDFLLRVGGTTCVIAASFCTMAYALGLWTDTNEKRPESSIKMNLVDKESKERFEGELVISSEPRSKVDVGRVSAVSGLVGAMVGAVMGWGWFINGVVDKDDKCQIFALYFLWRNFGLFAVDD